MCIFRIAGAVLAAALVFPGLPVAAETLPSECRRFESKAKPHDFQPRLARLCVRLIDAHDSDAGMSADELEAARRLGHYLAVTGEIDIRRGAVGLGGTARRGQPMTETSRYLIADRIGLLAIADRLAPADALAALR